MTSERECHVYIVLPGETEFVTAARFTVTQTRDAAILNRLMHDAHRNTLKGESMRKKRAAR